MQKSAEWFQADYLAGEDYFNLNFLDAVSLLASNESPVLLRAVARLPVRHQLL